VLRYDEYEDGEDFDSPLRPVQPVATGVDKEEEDVPLMLSYFLLGNTFKASAFVPTAAASLRNQQG